MNDSNTAVTYSSFHGHGHSHCDHEMAYCPICDVAYCTKCGREWGRRNTWYYTYPVWTQYGTYTVSASNDSSHQHGS